MRTNEQDLREAWPLISERTVPPVAGIDLAQSMNYVDSTGLDLAWFYRCYTSPRTFYQPGKRPTLDAIVDAHVDRAASDVERLRQCLAYLQEHMAHYSHVGVHGPPDRALTEEALLASGEGWCNEQARVLLALTQVAGLPSRLIFAAMASGRGHVLTEVSIDGHWCLADQTHDAIFFIDGRPVNVLDVRTDTAIRDAANAFYAERLRRDRARADDPAVWDDIVAYGKLDEPMALFHSVGYCNYSVV